MSLSEAELMSISNLLDFLRTEGSFSLKQLHLGNTRYTYPEVNEVLNALEYKRRAIEAFTIPDLTHPTNASPTTLKSPYEPIIPCDIRTARLGMVRKPGHWRNVDLPRARHAQAANPHRVQPRPQANLDKRNPRHDRLQRRLHEDQARPILQPRHPGAPHGGISQRIRRLDTTYPASDAS
jgi:hypothetical protein